MNRKLILPLAGAAAIAGAAANLNSPDARGYLDRGIMMYNDRNFEGCIDQMVKMGDLAPDASQEEEAFYYLAMATMGLGDDEGITLLRAYLDKYPQSARRMEARMSIADALFSGASYGEALKEYALVDPESLNGSRRDDFYYRKAYSYIMLAEYDKAAPLLEKLARSRTYANASKFYTAYIAFAKGDNKRALELFKSVDTSSEPGNTAPYYLAQLYYGMGDNRAALDNARKMIASDIVPQFTVESKRIAGEALYNLGDREAALPYLWDYAANTEQPLPSAFYILGVSEFDKGEYKAAIKLLQKAANLNDAMGQSAYLYLGQAYLKDNNNDGALMAFENAYKMDYDSAVKETAFYNYAVAKSRGGRVPFGNSVAIFEDFLERFPKSRYAPQVQEYIVQGYMTDNDYTTALRSIERIENPSDNILAAKKRVLFVLGTREYAAGKVTEALSKFKQARDIKSGNADINLQSMLWEGDCHYKLNDPDRAAASYLEFIDRAESGEPNLALARYNLGYVRFNRGRFDEALTDFRQAINTTPTLSSVMLADAHNRIADCHSSKADYSTALAEYAEAMKLNPESADYPMYRSAMIKGLEGNYGSEAEMLDKMMSRFPDSPLVPDALLAKAEALSSLGDENAALATYSQLARDYSNTSQGRRGQLRMAITMMSLGRSDAAIEAYKKLIVEYPTSDEATLASDDLRQIYADRGRVREYINFMASVPNGPEINASEIDNATFQQAERAYLDNDSTELLKKYIAEFPHGNYEAQALYYLAEDAEDAGKPELAAEYSSQLLTIYPDSDVAEDALAIRASSELAQGKGEIALESFKQLEERSSTPRTLVTARIGILNTSLNLERYAEALSAADALLAGSGLKSDETMLVKFKRGLALSKLGRTDEAERQWAETADNVDDINGSRSAVYLAQSQLDRGDARKARKTADTFIDANPPHQYWLARGFIVLSDALRAQGETFEADVYLKSLRENYPGNEAEIFEMIESRLK